MERALNDSASRRMAVVPAMETKLRIARSSSSSGSAQSKDHRKFRPAEWTKPWQSAANDAPWALLSAMVGTMSAETYFKSLSGWQADEARRLRALIVGAANVTEGFKWGHPIYASNGPVCLIKSHQGHITFGFWRGADLLDIEPRLARQGQFEMASVKVTRADSISDETIRSLVRRGAELNAEKGDPLKAMSSKK